MWKGIFGNVNKFRAVSYMILLIENSLLGKLVPKDFNSAVFGFFILVFGCFYYEITAPVKPKKRKK